MSTLINKLYITVIFQVTLSLVLMCFAYQAYASREFTYSWDQKIETVIAANELNRIGIVGGEIIEVIGDESKYAIFWSGDRRNLFIKPKVEVGKTIYLSLVMPNGFVQDIRFTALDTSSQTIFINLTDMENSWSNTTSNLASLSDPQLKTEIANMMRAMIEGTRSKYYVMDVKRTIKQTKQQLIKQSLAYRYKDLSGAVLSVKNLTTNTLTLHESDFQSLFKNPIAINLDSLVIKPRATAQLFVITREINHD